VHPLHQGEPLLDRDGDLRGFQPEEESGEHVAAISGSAAP